MFAQVQALAVVDELTGVANRRRFFELGEQQVIAAIAADRPLAAMMIDIDHFKSVNDIHGHPTGDDVFRVVAARLKEVIRDADLLGRYGGEELAVLATDGQAGFGLPERLRACIADTPIQTRSGPLHVSVSIGVTYLTASAHDLVTLLAHADRGLTLPRKPAATASKPPEPSASRGEVSGPGWPALA